MEQLLAQIKQCRVCAEHLPHGPRPVMAAHPNSKIIIIGQAPGIKVHNSGTPWADASGDNLRSWMGLDQATFYNTQKVAILPMGFCYPGKGKSGDLPPRPECAPLWHQQVLEAISTPALTLLIGQYAQQQYLAGTAKASLTQTVQAYQTYLPRYFVLPHPSPRNNIWQAKNPWFKNTLLPALKAHVAQAIGA